MLAEVLLVLGGHPSSLFVPHPSQAAVPKTYQVSPALCEYLHPGEISSLNSLASLAFQYTQVKKWAASTLKLGREAVLAESLYSSRKGRQRQPEDSGLAAPDQYLSTLAANTLEVLSEYDLLIIDTEARILSFDASLVQDQQGYVPLTIIVATFDKWIAPIASLKRMVDQLSSTEHGDWTPGKIIDLVHEKTQTGNPFLKVIFTSLSNSLRHVFLTHLVSFILYGIAPTLSTPTSPAIGLDIGADPLSPQHRAFALNEELLPSSMQGKTKESILYVGRVAATLKREGRSLPTQLVSGLREHIMSVKWLEEGEGLGEAIEKARAEVGEWLWKHILTGAQVADSIETLGNFFLLRKADYAISTIREISQLRLDKLITSNPHSSSSVIREQDLDLALRRASVGTSAGQDAGLDKLRYKMEKGPLRAILPSLPPKVPRKGGADRSGDGLPDERSNIRQLFSSSLLGTPLTLTTTITWPLDLFMTPLAISTYSDIQSYLTAIRHTHLAVLNCWTSLSAAQRQRRKWTGVTEGGTPEEADARKWLARTAWGTVRLMLFFIDQLQSHFMTDIIDVQHRRLLEQLEIDNVSSSTLDGSLRGSMRGSVRGSVSRTAPTPVKSAAASTVEGRRPASPYNTETQGLHDSQSIRPNRAPPTPSRKQGPSFLDFLTLRQIHTRHLAFLREALLISDVGIATLTRDILDTCRRFTGLVERWGGDVLPELLMEGIEGEEVGKMVQERAQAVEEINEALHEHLTDFFGALLETQQPGASDPDRSTTGGGSLSRTMRVAQISRMMSRQTSLTAAAMNNVNKGAKSKVQLEKEEKGLEAEAAMARHIDQLLLRLDFNEVLTAWRLKGTDGEYMGSVLVEGGL